MKFLSYDSEQKQESETEIRNVELETIHLFVQTWVPDFLFRSLRDPRFPYHLFQWEEIIRFSFWAPDTWQCYGAFTGTRLDGLLCLGIGEDKLKVEYLATAPWNYSDVGKMRGIGSGLIYFTVINSIDRHHQGELWLDATPDSEGFYKKIGMIATGNVNDSGLKEYAMSKNEANSFLEKFKKHVTK